MLVYSNCRESTARGMFSWSGLAPLAARPCARLRSLARPPARPAVAARPPASPHAQGLQPPSPHPRDTPPPAVLRVRVGLGARERETNIRTERGAEEVGSGRERQGELARGSMVFSSFPKGESYCVADVPEHGGLCLFSSKEQSLLLWVRNSIGEWVLEKEFSLMNERMKKLHRDEWMKRVRILEVRSGYAYMEFWSIRKSHSYLLVLNLRTKKWICFVIIRMSLIEVLHSYSSCRWPLCSHHMMIRMLISTDFDAV
ncbi:hypothetical protein EJB05_01917, partial [Eragrostis curvula]